MTSIHRQLRVLVGALFISTLLTAGSVRGAPSGNTIYVKHDAVGNNDGSSWTDAYTDLQDALVIAQPGHEIWVAQGVYYPAPSALDRTATFELQDGVPLYGGFTGMETEREQRDWIANITVLSGDLDRNDITTNGVVTDTANIVGDNAYHVVTGGGVTETAVLAGFTITAGKADGGTGQTRGGGMYNTASSPTLTNVTFSGNHADGYGGGMANYEGSSPKLTHVTFSGNYANDDAGGMCNNRSSPMLTNVTFSGNHSHDDAGGMVNIRSSPTLTNVTFSGNSAYYDAGGMKNWESSPTLTLVTFSGNYTRHSSVFVTRGGGMLNSRNSSPTLTNVTFSGNSAGSLGGGMHNDESSPTLTNVVFSGNDANLGGGMCNDRSSPKLTHVTFSGNYANDGGGGMRNDRSSPMLTNVVFSGNYANGGGGMRNRRNSSPTLTNVTFSGNQAGSQGGGMYNDESSPTLTNCIVWGNEALQGPEIFSFDDDSQPTVSYSSIRGNYPGEGNIDADPLFVEPVSADKAPTTDGDYRLTEGSPAIDAGTNDVITADTDLDGNPRIVDGTGDGNAIVDMGAYEYLEVLLTIVKEGQGLVAGASGLVDCGNLCTAGFLADTEVTLTATADPSWSFVGWSGDVESIENSLELTIQDDTELIATFEPREMKVYLPLILADR